MSYFELYVTTALTVLVSLDPVPHLLLKDVGYNGYLHLEIYIKKEI